MLRKQRMARGMTQTELSEMLRRPQPYISTIETGVRRLDVLELREICRALGVSVVDLVADWDAEVCSPDGRDRK